MKKNFECPICGYQGPFSDITPKTGIRKHAQCPECKAYERHRLQFLVVNGVLSEMDTSRLKMLHFAPEKFFTGMFSGRFGSYETADISMEGVDHQVDLQSLPFDDDYYDFIFASHVLEHVPDDAKALSGISRILKPGGLAILPVPVVAEKTIEYPEANPNESYHVRAPGLDYFERYKGHFSGVELQCSDSFPEKYQLYIYEDRSNWPTEEAPLRTPMAGKKHPDIVPICYG